MLKTICKIVGLSLMTLYSCSSTSERRLVVLDRVEVLHALAREPMLAQHPSGDLFVAGYRNASDEPQLWRSDDGGKTWKSVNVGNRENGADGNSDVDLIIDREGVIYFVTMRYTRIPPTLENLDSIQLQGEHIAIGVSEDRGGTWRWEYLSKNAYDDRPWVEVASDGSVHVIWNDGNGIHYVQSQDRGKTWIEQPQIYIQGGSSHFAAGPDGYLAVRVSPLSASGFTYHAGIDLIRLSNDLGSTWSTIPLPEGNRIWSSDLSQGILRWVEPLAWDRDNTLYHIWSEGKILKLGITEDLGKTWTIYEIETSEDTIYYPFLSIQHDVISCSWVSGFEADLRHHAAVIHITGSEVNLSKLEPLLLDEIKGRFNSSELPATGGEYFPVQALPDGTFGMVTTIQDYKSDRLGFTWWRLGLSP